ncbi:uncharacterized protein TNCV_4367771 [Trichonephila clavipes]|nr:uncharacterized protein TNCV_4367771 [Trichonephila clavipes]
MPQIHTMNTIKFDSSDFSPSLLRLSVLKEKFFGDVLAARNAQQLFRVRPQYEVRLLPVNRSVGLARRQSLKNAWNKLWPDLEGKKDFKDDHREKITDFVQSIPGFQECDEEECRHLDGIRCRRLNFKR